MFFSKCGKIHIKSIIVTIFKKIYWSVVALQSSVSFCSAAKWISYVYTHIVSFLNFLPIEVTTKLWVEFPMLYSRFSLVTCFIHSSVYMSVPISRFIPPSFHPLVTVCFFSVSLFLLCTRVRLSVPFSKIPHMCVNTRCFSLATIEYTAQQRCAHSRCVTISTVHLQKFSTSQPDTLCPVHHNALSSVPSAPGNLLCALFPVIYLSWAPHTKGSLQHLSFSGLFHFA